VVFDAAALWGDAAQPGLQVAIDAWEPYLEPDTVDSAAGSGVSP
jgi:hypothetical protein